MSSYLVGYIEIYDDSSKRWIPLKSVGSLGQHRIKNIWYQGYIRDAVRQDKIGREGIPDDISEEIKDILDKHTNSYKESSVFSCYTPTYRVITPEDIDSFIEKSIAQVKESMESYYDNIHQYRIEEKLDKVLEKMNLLPEKSEDDEDMPTPEDYRDYIEEEWEYVNFDIAQLSGVSDFMRYIARMTTGEFDAGVRMICYIE